MGTTLLLGAIITILVRIVKWLTAKIGGEMAGAITLIVAFLFSALAALLWKGWSLGDFKLLMNWEVIVSLFGISMAIYEVVVKRIIKPVLDKISDKMADIN
jgi:hypothetical protein